MGKSNLVDIRTKRRRNKMDRMIAYCGIICTKCPVYKATQANDDKAREDVIKLCSKLYGIVDLFGIPCYMKPIF